MRPLRSLGVFWSSVSSLARDLAANYVDRGRSRLRRHLPGCRAAVDRARAAWLDHDLAAGLAALADAEAHGCELPVEVGQGFERALADIPSRVNLSAAAEPVLAQWPDSIPVLYARIMGLIELDSFAAAHDLVSDALLRALDGFEQHEGPLRKRRGHLLRLLSLWKVVDAAARDQMCWAVESRHEPQAYIDLPFVRRFEALPAELTHGETELTLGFAEPYLQGKQQTRFLERCRKAFDETRPLQKKLNAIKSMIRSGLRREVSYTPCYELARACFAELDADLRAIEAVLPVAATQTSLRGLRSAYGLARQLGLDAEAARMRATLVACAGSGDQPSASIWIIGNTLGAGDPGLDRLYELAADPDDERDARDFFQWATRAGAYERAHRVFAALSPDLQVRQSTLSYVNILQRSGRFEEAERRVRDVHARLLVKPEGFDPQTSYTWVRRAGELGFAAQTARYFSQVPQPSQPVGVIFATPRNIEQLRRTPLVVLMEWKRQGWAVLPVFEGVLPVEPTGIAAIDRLAAGIRLANNLGPFLAARAAPGSGVVVDLAAGRFEWRDIDLSHALWEEATISRRVYTPDWTCPALHLSLGHLVRWTSNIGVFLETARQDLAEIGLRAGIHVFSNFRLPDALVRFYCERHGDEKAFFCIHSTNGYENYFANFASNISTRMSIRNVTSYSDTRGCSFPPPEAVEHAVGGYDDDIEAFAQLNVEIDRIAIRDTHQGEEAKAARQRIEAWKAAGGKVACAFGKIVCDSGVPYDGGPVHASMQDWINDTVASVAGSNTLLLIKPHPYELRESIGCFLNQTFREIITEPFGDNVIYLGHDWFEIREIAEFLDLALIYNSTTAIEVASIGVPAVVCSHFAPVDYPVGHAAPMSREEYHRMVRFEQEVPIAPDGRERAASWLHLMNNGTVAANYRYHSRQVTNCVIYPPRWFETEIDRYMREGDPEVTRLAQMGLACRPRHPQDAA